MEISKGQYVASHNNGVDNSLQSVGLVPFVFMLGLLTALPAPAEQPMVGVPSLAPAHYGGDLSPYPGGSCRDGGCSCQVENQWRSWG